MKGAPAFAYDVFLSHNGRDKPWVRQLYAFLIARDKRVFFDEVSVAPGANLVTAIEDGLEQSRYIVLVLSPAALSSRWVAAEMQWGLDLDPDAGQRRVIPIVVTKLNRQALRLSVRSLVSLDLTDPAHRLMKLQQLLAAIGVENVQAGDLAELAAGVDVPPATASALQVAGLDEVLDWGWTPTRLLDALIELDYQTLDGLVAADEGTSAQWGPVFHQHPGSWRILTTAPEEIRGYWHFAHLFDDDYERARAGKLQDSEIDVEHMRLFEGPGQYNLYFVQLCLHPKFRQPAQLLLLFRSVFDVFDELARAGIFIKEICANAYTDAGRALCRSFGMEYLTPHSTHGRIYAAKTGDILKGPAGSHHASLLQAYRRAGLA